MQKSMENVPKSPKFRTLRGIWVGEPNVGVRIYAENSVYRMHRKMLLKIAVYAIKSSTLKFNTVNRRRQERLQ